MNLPQSFDPVWEKKYSEGHSQRYPWDSVVSFVLRNYPRDKQKNEVKILEVGCGTASNLWFAAREGFSVAGIDASHSAIEVAKKTFVKDGLSGDFVVADFTQLPFEDNHFDLVIDRASLSCCGFLAGKQAIREIYRVMRPGAKFFFNPYSDRHSSCSSGCEGPDGLTLEIAEGTLVGVGQICFYGRQHIIHSLSEFSIVSLQHLERTEFLYTDRSAHAEWRVIAEKTS